MDVTVAELARLPGRLANRLSSDRARRRLMNEVEALIGTRGAAETVASATTGSTGPRVGFATFGSGPWHLVLDALLAHALALRGARPELLVCDLPDLPICDERTIHSRHRERCAGCVDDKRALLGVCGLPWRGVSTFVAEGTLARARAKAAVLDAAGIEAYEERGWPIGQWLHVSACHFLRCDARGDGAEKIDAHRRLLTSAIVIVDAVHRWLDEARPDVVVALSGAHLEWRIAMELAHARGIPVVCREMGKGGWDRHIYALDADCMSPHLEHEWSRQRNEPLSAVERAEVDRFLDRLPENTYVQKTPVTRKGDGAGLGDAAGLRARLGIPAGKTVMVAFTNVTWDLATAGRDVGFAGVFDWLRETIGVAAGLPEVHLIIRAHPAEASVLTRERILDQIAQAWPAGPPGVTLIPPEQPIGARDLCAIADLVLAYNSTAGLEAAADGHTVVVGGNPHYRGKGFTLDVSSKAEHAHLLVRWASGGPLAPPDQAAELARRYAQLFFLRYHVPMGWTTSPLEPPYQLTIRSMTELQPGRNPSLDVVCQGILEGRQILLPRQPPT